MIGSSHLQLCKKNIGFVKLKSGPLDHNPRKISVEDFIFNKFVNYSCWTKCAGNLLQFCVKNTTILAIFCRTAVSQNKSICLLLNDTSKCHMIHWSVCWTKYRDKQRWTCENQKKVNLKKRKRNRISCFNIYVQLYLHFCHKLHQNLQVNVKRNVCFRNTFLLLYLTATTYRMTWRFQE